MVWAFTNEVGQEGNVGCFVVVNLGNTTSDVGRESDLLELGLLEGEELIAVWTKRINN